MFRMGSATPEQVLGQLVGLTLERDDSMAAMKPRTGEGPMEAAKEGRYIIMRIPTEGGGRSVIQLTPDEARELATVLAGAVGGTFS